MKAQPTTRKSREEKKRRKDREWDDIAMNIRFDAAVVGVRAFGIQCEKKNVAFPESTNVYTFNVIIVGLEKCDHVNEWVS